MICEKVWFTINALSKMLFFNFYVFNFFKFQMTIVKNLMGKWSFFIMDVEGSCEVTLCHKYFWPTYFWYFHGNAFCFFIFLNERNITTSHLMIHLKCTVVHHANLNSSSKNKPHLRATEHSFIQFLIYVYINEAFTKNFMKKLSFFNTNFQNSF